MKTNKEKTIFNPDNLDSLISELKNTDGQFKKATKILYIVFFVFILIYAVIYLIFPDSDTTLSEKIGGGCYIAGFTFFTIYFWRKFRKYKALNYADPVKIMLEKAEKRFRFWQGNPALSILGILSISTGSYFMYEKYFSEYYTSFEILIFIQSVFMSFVLIGFIFGYVKWKKELKPIWIAVKEILTEFQN